MHDIKRRIKFREYCNWERKLGELLQYFNGLDIEIVNSDYPPHISLHIEVIRDMATKNYDTNMITLLTILHLI